jgi:hypothetical protein
MTRQERFMTISEHHHAVPAACADRAGIIDRSASRMTRAWRFIRQRVIQDVIRLVPDHGSKASLGFLARNIRHSIAAPASRRFDSRLGVNTAVSIQLHGLTIDSPNKAHDTEAVSPSPTSFA